jgi:hypothetical protein
MAYAQDSVSKLVKNGGLSKTLNTLRTVPGATNPFVAAQQRTNAGGSGNSSNSYGKQR